MARLIYDKGVVQERTDVNPVTGCWRVVYEKQGEGAVFRQLLDEEEAFPKDKGLFKTMVTKALAAGPDYIVYAVSKEQYLQLDFPKRISHQNHINHFDLNFIVEYHVADPRIVVEHLRAGPEDPLTRVREMIIIELGGACARKSWDLIKDEYAFSEVAQELTSPASEVFRRVQGKARYLGLAVTDIKLSLRLLERDVKPWKDGFEHEQILGQKIREKEIAKAEEEIKNVRTMYEAQREVVKGGAEALKDSLITIGRDTHTASQLRDNVDTLGSLFFPQMNPANTGAAALPEKPTRLLTENTNDLLGKGLSVLQQVVNMVVELDLRENEKRDLLSAIFHLSGEVLATEETHPDALTDFRETYRVILKQSMRDLSTQQYNTLERLLNVERL
jgi:hypothetical protein